MITHNLQISNCQLNYNFVLMKGFFAMLIFAFMVSCTSARSAKLIRSQHPQRRLDAKPERRLMFGSSDTEQEMDEASEHSHMSIMMNMMEKNSLISNIMKNVKRFSVSLDDLSEAVNTQIVQLASVANSNLGKNLYLSKI